MFVQLMILFIMMYDSHFGDDFAKNMK